MQKKEAVLSFGNKENYQRLYSLLDPNKPVYVYRNLRTNLWSVKQSGRVVCHTDYITLHNVSFVVRTKGRERVLKENQKNVHAFVKGYIVERPPSIDPKGEKDWIAVTYNPYKYGYFYDKCSHLPVKEAEFVDMTTVNDQMLGEPVLATK